jgi:predicted transcriptional regulator
MLKLSKSQLKFLCYLNNLSETKLSVHHIGKMCFKTWKATSFTLDFFYKNKLIIKEQRKNHLIITLTKKGKDYIIKYFQQKDL